jgi:hypothetical protein
MVVPARELLGEIEELRHLLTDSFTDLPMEYEDWHYGIRGSAPGSSA